MWWWERWWVAAKVKVAKVKVVKVKMVKAVVVTAVVVRAVVAAEACSRCLAACVVLSCSSQVYSAPCRLFTMSTSFSLLA